MLMNIPVKIKLLPKSRCIVRNYRRKHDQWEPGEVQNVEAGFNASGGYRVSYRVMLDRTVLHKRGYETYLFVTVGDDAIQPE